MEIKLFLFFLFAGYFSAAAQEHQHDHSHDHAHAHKNEIGVANAPVFFVKEKIFSYGLHVHYVRTIRASKFGVGGGYERIFDAHGHNTFGVLGSYRPVERLSLILSPGITFEDEHPDELNFAFHAEMAYEFLLGDFHLGPVLEFAYDPEDIHISLGIHFGIGFEFLLFEKHLRMEK